MSIQKVFQTEELRNIILQHYYVKRYFQKIYENVGHCWYDYLTLEELLNGGAFDNITIGKLKKFRNTLLPSFKNCLKSKFPERNIAKFDKEYTIECRCEWKTWKQEFIITPIAYSHYELELFYKDRKSMILSHPNDLYNYREKTQNTKYKGKNHFVDFIYEFADFNIKNNNQDMIKQTNFLEYMYDHSRVYFDKEGITYGGEYLVGEHITKILMNDKKSPHTHFLNHLTMINYNPYTLYIDGEYKAFIKEVDFMFPNLKTLEFINKHYGNLSDLLMKEHNIKETNNKLLEHMHMTSNIF